MIRALRSERPSTAATWYFITGAACHDEVDASCWCGAEGPPRSLQQWSAGEPPCRHGSSSACDTAITQAGGSVGRDRTRDRAGRIIDASGLILTLTERRRCRLSRACIASPAQSTRNYTVRCANDAEPFFHLAYRSRLPHTRFSSANRRGVSNSGGLPPVSLERCCWQPAGREGVCRIRTGCHVLWQLDHRATGSHRRRCCLVVITGRCQQSPVCEHVNVRLSRQSSAK